MSLTLFVRSYHRLCGDPSSNKDVLIIVVVGVHCRLEDEEAGEVPMAYVVRSPESHLTSEEIIQFVAAQVQLSLSQHY